MPARTRHSQECGYDFKTILEVMLVGVPCGASVGYSFHRPIENADFSKFARHTKVANPAFLPIWLAELVQFLLK
jgi:hypothetical protein